jgi:glutaminase
MDEIDRIFDSLDTTSRGYIYKDEIIEALAIRGIVQGDLRIKETMTALKKHTKESKISPKEFRSIVGANITLIEKAVTGNLIIPDFKNFCSFITNLYNRTLQDKKGTVSSYLTTLKNMNAEGYAISICTVDGQQFNLGDFSTPYTVRSTSKPITYCIALEEKGEIEVHEHVGRTPNEGEQNEFTLDAAGKPHNPLNGAGGIMCSSLIQPTLKPDSRFTHMQNKWKDMAGGNSIGFNADAFAEEQQIADKEFATAYFMKDKKLFANGNSPQALLEVYFKCLSFEITTESQAVMAATLANAGVCPTNGKEVFGLKTAKNCLSLMSSCGTEDYSSEFAFSIGLPAKSGNSGAIMIVIPDVMGIAIWSPRLDENNNSVRGIHFCHKLIERFNFHAFDSAIKNPDKIDPRLKKNATKMSGVMAVCNAGSQGDVHELQRLVASGIDLNEGDYDLRTGIHLAASEGHVEAVKFFVEQKANLSPKDRWGGTPLADALREKHTAVAELLKKHKAIE